MNEEIQEELEQQEVVETETDVEETEPSSEVVEETSEEVVEELTEVVEPKTVPLDALQDERRKRQELEQQLNEIRSGVESLKNDKPPKDIYEAYQRDSKGVMNDLNAEIKRLASDDAYSNAAQIEQLRDLKDDLRRREFSSIQQQLNQQTTASKTMSMITNHIPDFAKKVDTLTKFAIEELGYTQEELAQRTALDKGEESAREVVRIHRLYEKMNAKPQAKVVKPKPAQVEGAGKGVQKVEPNMSELMKKAQETGDWTEYFDARGLLPDD